MPSRLALGADITSIALRESYVCTTCLLRDASRPRLEPFFRTTYGLRTSSFRPISTRARKTPRIDNIQRRRVSSGRLASVTAINPPPTVPPGLQKLHRAVVTLSEKAGSFVDLSRLQLVLRSLENRQSTTRVALLGLGANGAVAARKLARLLLSDPLNDEEPWEQQVLDSSTEQSLLLRYGAEDDLIQNDPLIRNVNVPSPYLQRHKLEILVTSVNPNRRVDNQTSRWDWEEALLVPILPTTTSSSGRVGVVRCPVHKALLVAEGVSGAVEYGRLPSDLADGELINAALDLPLRVTSTADVAKGDSTDPAIDVDLATHALEIFRSSRANGAQYGTEWQSSRISSVSDWIKGREASDQSGLSLVVRAQVGSLLNRISKVVDQVQSEQDETAITSFVPSSTRQELQDAITEWSAEAHTDLQLNLTTALDSRAWKRTAWFRLLWRIDDVPFSAADVLRLSWLTEAEQTLAFLSGRIVESRVATSSELKEADMPVSKTAEALQLAQGVREAQDSQGVEPVAELIRTPDMLERIQQGTGANKVIDPPWPQIIQIRRQEILNAAIAEMHRKAQALLLSAITTIGGTGALGGWLWVATSGVAVFEAGAIASLGLVWSLRRLQKHWERERTNFAAMLREDGRQALAQVEQHLRRIVQDGGKSTAKSSDESGSWREARQAVEACREALAEAK